MSRHAQRRRVVARGKVAASICVVGVFVALFVGGAVGGSPEPTKVADGQLSGVVQRDGTVTTPVEGGATLAPSSDQPFEDVPPARQKVKRADKKLARSAEYLSSRSTLTFRVSSFNVLGASHTAPGGERKGWAAGPTRMRWAASLLTSAGVTVAGLQEVQPSQHAAFRSAAPGWTVYPPAGSDRMSRANAIVWRSDTWRLVEGRSISIPYFAGSDVAMPYVKLHNIETGREVWFMNTHNPADAHGPAQRFRNAAVAREIALARTLTADGTPMIMTGDMNDREPFFCPVTAQTDLHAANGGSTGTACAIPKPSNVDWIMGSAPIGFSNYVSTKAGLVARTTDHPFVYADATISPQSSR